MTASAVFASSAVAFPTKTSPCSGCHSGANVPVTATLAGTPGRPRRTRSAAQLPTRSRSSTARPRSRPSARQAASSRSPSARPTPCTRSRVRARARAREHDRQPRCSCATPPPRRPPTPWPPTCSGTITLTATDNAGGSGVATTYCRLDGGAPDRGRTINVWAWARTRSSSGRWTWRATQKCTRPRTSRSPPDGPRHDRADDEFERGGHLRRSATITLAATDNVGGSGVATTYYRLDGGAQIAGRTISVSHGLALDRVLVGRRGR